MSRAAASRSTSVSKRLGGGEEGLTARRLEARGRGGGRQQDTEEVILGWDVMGWDG